MHDRVYAYNLQFNRLAVQFYGSNFLQRGKAKEKCFDESHFAYNHAVYYLRNPRQLC